MSLCSVHQAPVTTVVYQPDCSTGDRQIWIQTAPIKWQQMMGRLWGHAAVGLANITEHQRITKLCHQISILNFLFLKRMFLLWTNSQMVTSGRTDIRDQSPGPKFPLFDKCQNMESYMIHAFLAPSPSMCTVFTVYGATAKPLTLSFSRTRSKLQAWKRSCFCRRCVDKSMVVRIKIQ